MERLLNFVYQYRAFFAFLVLEACCAWLVVQNNQYQSTKFFNSSNRFAAGILSFSQGVREYFSLRTINSDLARENALLKSSLEQRRQASYLRESPKDTSAVYRYVFISAKVVNNSTALFKNYITINKGTDSGIEPGMAVVSSAGAVGKVKAVSEHYAVVISLLNIDEQVSSVIRSSGYFGTAQWDGVDPRVIPLRYIPRHVHPVVGDTVLTSGYNAIFPEGVPVGIIKEVNLREEALWYDIKVELAQDFGRLSYVQVVKSYLLREKDSLERTTIGEPK